MIDDTLGCASPSPQAARVASRPAIHPRRVIDRGGAGAAHPRRGPLERLAGRWGRLWDRLYGYIDRDTSTDEHTRAIAGDVDGPDCDKHPGTDEPAEAGRRPDPNLSGANRPRPYLLRSYTDAHGAPCGVTINYDACAHTDVRRHPGQVMSDEGG